MPRHRRRYRSLELDEVINTVWLRLALRFGRRSGPLTPAYVHTSVWKEARHYFARDLPRFHRPPPAGFTRRCKREEQERLARAGAAFCGRGDDGCSAAEFAALDAALLRATPETQHDAHPKRFPDPRLAGAAVVSRSTRCRRRKRAIAQLARLVRGG